ncbi:glycoside hydrolase family 127 protein [Microbacterium halophytorum]|uniref:glycoside hydrolase family 127 protein n=1 Tax=Microbacterium halophytorum TaxID=2067568 RepID=UPI0018E08769|nr:beta-L-arabinofuranosidase domain-containing protein [Microbacterium halophytorum]
MTDASTHPISAPTVPSAGRLRPLGIDEVAITGGFWHERQRANRGATLAHVERWLEREGWIRNFDLAASGGIVEQRRGREFADSEVYKYLEAVAWELGRAPDDELEARLRRIVARVAAAQEPDGYLNTNFGRAGQAPRWSDLAWGHELYCLGHLFQAAAARHRTAPDADDGLVGVAARAADLVCEVFGEGGIASVCGHAEIETALVELGRALGEPRYVEQARLFVERRGTGTLPAIEFGPAYFQDDVPVRESTVMRGHAVRANYLASGAADVAVETGDAPLLDALVTQWRTTVARRTYITGGQGAHHQDEAFGADFELPSDRAYSETCAGIASVQFSWRLLLARGGAEYADLIERTLYNVVATSPSDEGTVFYYANTLHQRTPGAPADPDAAVPRAESSLRAPWFSVACCPPNVARTLASLAAYVATADDDGVQLHQFAPSTVRTSLGGGRSVALAVDTEYPRAGEVSVTIGESPGGEWALSLRVPAWAEGARCVVEAADGSREEVPATPGYAVVRREFASGDRVVLSLPMAPRVTRPDPRIDAVRGTIAVERGPEVYALESVDLPGGADVADAELVADEPPREADGRVVAMLRLREHPDAAWPFGTAQAPASGAPVEVPLVPYHSWAQRGPSTMRVWIPEAG